MYGNINPIGSGGPHVVARLLFFCGLGGFEGLWGDRAFTWDNTIALGVDGHGFIFFGGQVTIFGLQGWVLAYRSGHFNNLRANVCAFVPVETSDPTHICWWCVFRVVFARELCFRDFSFGVLLAASKTTTPLDSHVATPGVTYVTFILPTLWSSASLKFSTVTLSVATSAALGSLLVVEPFSLR